MQGALKGIKVLDLSRVLAGPYCTMILGDLGADVIKVEAPDKGDETRKWGPPFQGDVSAYFLSANRNKKSITIDLKSEGGINQVKQLIRDSDVVINNFKTGTMEKFGLSYDGVRSINKQIIYCSITGFGEEGPYSQISGYDFIIQAMSGLMSITGDSNSEPQKVGVAIVDVLTGLYANIGIQAALLERTRSGEGQKIDLSLYDSAVSSLVNIGSNYLMSGSIPKRLGNQHANIVPYQTFVASDGEMVIAVGNDEQFERLCEILEIPKTASDIRFQTNPNRVKNRELLIPILQTQFLKYPIDYWKKKCDQNDIPCGPIQNLEEVYNDPQLQARNMFMSMKHPSAGQIHMIGSPLKLSRTPVTLRNYPPDIGEHNNEILNKKEME